MKEAASQIEMRNFLALPIQKRKKKYLKKVLREVRLSAFYLLLFNKTKQKKFFFARFGEFYETKDSKHLLVHRGTLRSSTSVYEATSN